MVVSLYLLLSATFAIGAIAPHDDDALCGRRQSRVRLENMPLTFAAAGDWVDGEQGTPTS